MPPDSPPITLILPETSSSTFKLTSLKTVFPAGTETVSAVAMACPDDKRINNKSSENQVTALVLVDIILTHKLSFLVFQKPQKDVMKRELIFRILKMDLIQIFPKALYELFPHENFLNTSKKQNLTF